MVVNKKIFFEAQGCSDIHKFPKVLTVKTHFIAESL